MPLEQDQYLEPEQLLTPEYMNRTGRVTSRLAKKEQKKLTRQTILFSGIALVLLLLFLFVIMPGAIRLAGNIVGTNLGGQPTDVIPPVAPTISAPPEATSDTRITIAGYSEKESEVVLVLNSREYAREPVDEDGAFEFTILLEEGEHTLAFYAVDAAGNESTTTRTYTVISDRTPPVIDVENPSDGATLELRQNQSLTVRGSAGERARVYLNDRLLFSQPDGSFTGTYQLEEGENMLSFKAIDLAGNEAEKTITVHFRF